MAIKSLLDALDDRGLEVVRDRGLDRLRPAGHDTLARQPAHGRAERLARFLLRGRCVHRLAAFNVLLGFTGFLLRLRESFAGLLGSLRGLRRVLAGGSLSFLGQLLCLTGLLAGLGLCGRIGLAGWRFRGLGGSFCCDLRETFANWQTAVTLCPSWIEAIGCCRVLTQFKKLRTCGK